MHKPLPNPWSVFFLVCIIALLVGCASTQQTMTTPPGKIELTLAGPSGKIDPKAQAYRQGPVIVVIGCQIGVTAKPVGLDILNPAVAATVADNNVPVGGSSGSLTDESVGAKIAESVRQSQEAKDPPAPEVAAPATESPEAPAKQAGDTASDGAPATPVADEATKAPEEQTAAPSGGG